MSPTLELSVWDLSVAAGLVGIAALVSLLLRLGSASRLAIAAGRTVVQLSLLGLVLEWVFRLDQWWIVLALTASMIVNASLTAISRTDRRYPGIWSTGFLAVSVSSVFTTIVVTQVVVGVDPWYAPRYVIPLLGMVLGNSLTGVSLALDRFMTELDSRGPEVELWLSVGATAWEATRPLVRDAVRTGLVPIINAMTVAGIVSLPGMMTGQILAGNPPLQAVAYQIVVMFMIAGTVGIGAMLGVLVTWRHLVTPAHQVATHRMTRKGEG